ncbi:MAG: 4Fe-4S cluster-binding domain-containing protein, partial [Clostridia bacterium]
MEKCNLCPHKCNVIRSEKIGFCGATDKIKIALASLHYYEEPCISGKNGSGTIFFSHCNLKCVYCQNYKISQEDLGKPISILELANIFLDLEAKKANNINLVTPTIYALQIKEAIKIARNKG